MWRYFKFEWVQFFTNKKNVAIYCLLLFAVIFYSFKVAPAYDPIEKVDVDEIEARYLTRAAFLQKMELRDVTNLHPAVLMAIDVFNYINPYDQKRLDALSRGDLSAYAEATSEWYDITNSITYNNESFAYNARYYSYGSQYAEDNAFYAYFENTVRYKMFAQADYDLSIALFEQRTALQTLERLLKGPLPLILIGCALLLAIDIVTKDRRNPTLLKGFPIADWKRLIAKGFVALLGGLALFIPILIGITIIGLQSGFGHFGLPVPYYTANVNWQQEGLLDVMSLGMFITQCVLLLTMWFIVIITLVLLCSVVFRHELVNLAIGILIIFGENFYFSRGVGFFWSVENYPTSYIQVGQIVSKIRNYYYTTDQLTVQLGITLLFIFAVILLILMMGITLNKRFKMVK